MQGLGTLLPVARSHNTAPGISPRGNLSHPAGAGTQTQHLPEIPIPQELYTLTRSGLCTGWRAQGRCQSPLRAGLAPCPPIWSLSWAAPICLGEPGLLLAPCAGGQMLLLTPGRGTSGAKRGAEGPERSPGSPERFTRPAEACPGRCAPVPDADTAPGGSTKCPRAASAAPGCSHSPACALPSPCCCCQGTASLGDKGTVSFGNWGTASHRDRGHGIPRDRGAASLGIKGAASFGDRDALGDRDTASLGGYRAPLLLGGHTASCPQGLCPAAISCHQQYGAGMPPGCRGRTEGFWLPNADRLLKKKNSNYYYNI